MIIYYIFLLGFKYVNITKNSRAGEFSNELRKHNSSREKIATEFEKRFYVFLARKFAEKYYLKNS